MKEALLYNKLSNGKVICLACYHRCKINYGQVGRCSVRKNINGTLYSLNYNKIIAENIDPIEKKPLFHFLPGSLTYSIATVGCNFKCLHCQNAAISQFKFKSENEFPGIETTPDDIVRAAQENHCASIAYTYTEPTIFVEFALETMKLARDNGIKNVWVSNGFFSDETWEIISPYLDAINIDLKFFNNEKHQKICQAPVAPILKNLEKIAKSKTHLEITTLLITGINDTEQEIEQMAKFIKKNLTPDIPWHVSAYHPAHKMTAPATTIEIVTKAYLIGKKTGLNYVYTGNIEDKGYQNTLCPKCTELLIERHGYIINNLLKKNHCPKCNFEIKIVL